MFGADRPFSIATVASRGGSPKRGQVAILVIHHLEELGGRTEGGENIVKQANIWDPVTGCGAKRVIKSPNPVLTESLNRRSSSPLSMKVRVQERIDCVGI